MTIARALLVGAALALSAVSALSAKAGRVALAATPCSSPPLTMTIDVAAGHRAISPLVYGMNADAELDQPGALGGFAQALSAAKPALVRLGGNRFTAWNWETNWSNAGSDYLYENDDYLSSSTTPGAAVTSTVQADAAAGAATLVTVPVSNYVAGDANGPVTVGSTVQTSRFKQNKPTGTLTTVPDKTDGVVYQNQFVNWMAHAVPGAQIMYSLDNEPNDWRSTHQEVHPQAITFDEIVNDDLRYAKVIKDTYAALGMTPPLVTGPALDGWQGQEDAANNDGSSTDYQTKGRFVDYYLKKMKAADTAAGHRLVDVLDVHWYPDLNTYIDGLGHSAAEVAAREQAPRSLWDPTYTEDSWIAQYFTNGPITLIPRLQGEIAQYDPGMKLAITEWNYGGGGDISGGIATADALGIFGKTGLDAATMWPLNDPDEQFTLGAFRIFRNYDGQGAAFGDTEVSATTSDLAASSVYASTDSAHPSRVVIVAINKNLAATPVTISLANAPQSGRASVYTLTSASPQPQAAPMILASAPGTFQYTMPAQSVSVIVPQPAGASPSFYAASPPAAVQGVQYSYTFRATGTPAPTFALASGALPAGLTLNAATGVLSGTPTALGTSTFTVRASNGAGAANTGSLSVTTAAAQAPAFTAASPPGGSWNTAYSYAFKASGTPKATYSVASGALPPGLCLDPSTGVLSGNTTTVGTYHFAVRATNGIAPAATTPTLTVAVAKPSAGSVLSWGEDSSAQLGPGYRPSSLVPAPVTFPAGTSIVQVATGINHGLALTSAGKVYAWGNNICGQLGNGTDGSCGNDIPVRTPALVPFPSGTPAIVAVAAGANHSLALTADGNVWGWGNNGLGELGVGTDSETRDAPVKTNLGSYAGKVVAIAGDGYSSVALTADGNVLTWGDNGRGALGRGSFTPDHVNTPGLVQLGPYAGTIVSIAAGGPQAGHVVALTRAGKVIAWGNNEQGQVGDATKTNRPAPVAVVAPAGLSAMPPIAAIGAGSYHSFARAKNGAVYGWGDNGYGELGDGNVSVEDPTPVAVAPPTGSATLPSLADIVGGDFHSAALTTGGVLYGTGNNGSGQIGDGTTDNHAYLAKTLLPPGTTVASVSTTTDFDLALVGKPGPFVARLTPRSGTVAGGAKEVIVGRGFAPGATVSFGGTAGTGVTVLSSTEIEVTAPAHAAGTVDVRVTTSAGTSPVFVGDRYTYG